MYEKAGFKRMAEFEGWPEGHVNVVLLQNTMSRNARCRFGVNRVTLTLRRSLPVFLSKRTISEAAGMSQRCRVEV